MINSRTLPSNVEAFGCPVARLSSKYQRVRSVIYDRMSALGIEAFKKDGKSYITPAQLKLLDELDNYLAKGNGRTTKKFIKLINHRYTPRLPDTLDTLPDTPYNLPDTPDTSDTPSSTSRNRRKSALYKELDAPYTLPDTPDTVPDIPDIAPDIRYTPNNLIPRNKTNDPSNFINKIDKMRAFYEFLDDAVDNGWRLTNEHLADLLQVDIEEVKNSHSWVCAGYDLNKFHIDLGEGVKEEWWKVDFFDETQKGVTYLGSNLTGTDSQS